MSRKLILQVISADGDETGWEHVSVVAKYRNDSGKVIERTPTWAEMCHIKDLFWFPEETVVQFHPPHSEYVNNHPHCLHLWRHETHVFPLPDSQLVGLKHALPPVVITT